MSPPTASRHSAGERDPPAVAGSNAPLDCRRCWTLPNLATRTLPPVPTVTRHLDNELPLDCRGADPSSSTGHPLG